jgi:hypothetical protein
MSEIGTQKLKYQNPAIGSQNEKWEQKSRRELPNPEAKRLRRVTSPQTLQLPAVAPSLIFGFRIGSGPPPQTRIGIST